MGTSQDPLSMGQLGVLLQEPQWESVGRELHAPHSPHSNSTFRALAAWLA